MDDKWNLNNNSSITLTSPDGDPFYFKVIITPTFDAGNGVSIIVTGKDVTGENKTCKYQLKNRAHDSYLDLFAQLSEDFGLRMPRNRQSHAKDMSNASFKELLCENLVPEILYGYGDPSVIRVEENDTEKKIWYYMVSTSNDAPNSFPICRTGNFKDWEFVGFVFPKGLKPAWAADGEFVGDFWAAEMHEIRNEFRVYFVARDKETLDLCIGVAKSSSPSGPFVPDPVPLLKGNMIDPHFFCLNDGTAYLYWKEDNNGVWPSRLIDLLFKNPHLTAQLFLNREDQITASFIQTLWPWIQTLKSMEGFLVQQILIEVVTSSFSAFELRLQKLLPLTNTGAQKDIIKVLDVMKTPVYAQRLSPDGSMLLGERKKVFENDQSWEAHLVEGTWVTTFKDKFYLFYSGNDFSTDQYGIGVAIGESPLGPYQKLSEPILKSTEKWWGPGHPSVAVGLDGKYQLFMHGFFPGKAGYKEFRALLSVSLLFERDRVIIE